MGTYYLDEDGDGFGVTESSITSCTLPEGYVVDDGDCDDDISAINPDAEEPCDEVDNDCDGEVDEEGLSLWYEDADADGYGTDSSTIEACAAVVEGYAAYSGDCDDTDGDVNPDAAEVCDEVDNDCDGDIDSDATDESTFYADADADGFGDVSSSTSSCSAPEGYVDDATDCDDTDESVNPDAVETCNEVDDDCDDSVDEEAFDATT